MRNIFDQYTQPENKLTHSLVSSLAQDKKLLREFLWWSVRKRFTARVKLSIVEQSLPGQSEVDEHEADRRGLPDACVFDENGWVLMIESKVASALSADQLRRHYNTISRRGYKQPNLLIITVDRYQGGLPPYVQSRTWREVYEWGIRQTGRSIWPKLFTDYFQTLEARMVQDEYLTAGTLTKFTGIPFDTENPYSYIEAKRLLKLIIDEFKANKKLVKALGVDTALPGRGAIKGVKGTVVWDFLQFKKARKAKSFTDYPHLTFHISYEAVGLLLTLPHRLNRGIKKKVFDVSFDEFCGLIGSVAKGMEKVVRIDRAAKPVIKVLQRHYPSQSQPGIQDAHLVFDLRTISKRKGGPEKYQPEWLRTAYEVMRNKRSNIQMQIGIEISLCESKVVKTEKALAILEESALVLEPFIKKALGNY